MTISFTEEMIMNPQALEDDGLPRNFRYYRQEVYNGGHWPVECGHIYLPPNVDITKLEDMINGN